MDCSWPLHCPISRKEGHTTLHVAVDKEGAMMDSVPSFWGAPFLPNTGPPALGSGSRDPADLSVALAQPVSMDHRSFRLMLEDSTFQALREEPLFKRLHTKCAALPGGEGSLLSLPFPRKWWTIVNSHRFMSFWWEEDGTCVGINEELFENMERVGSDKLFETDCMKSFVCQLSLYGFSKAHQDVLTSLCLTTLLMEELPVCVLSKLQFCCSFLFKRDSPHLLRKMKRRVGVKSASRQVALSIESPRLCFTWPPAQMAPPVMVVGPTTVPTQIFSLPPGQLPVAMLVPLCTTWMSVVAAGPDPKLTLTAQAQNPFYYCSGSPSFP